jgi:hypothetical protein
MTGHELDERARQIPDLTAAVETGAAGLVERADHLSVDVELELADRVVPHSHRSGVGIAREPGEFVFRQPSLAGDAVDDLRIGWSAGNCAQQPVVPRSCLVAEACACEREQRDCGVAEPAVAVVPVADTAEALGQ